MFVYQWFLTLHLDEYYIMSRAIALPSPELWAKCRQTELANMPTWFAKDKVC